jgi:hypothetical protein
MQLTQPDETVTYDAEIHCMYTQVMNLQTLSFVRDVTFEDRPVSSLRDPKNVRVHIAQTGICGSDLATVFDSSAYSCLPSSRFNTG